MSDLLRTKLWAVRRKSVLVSVGSGLCVAIGAAIAAIGLEMFFDWECELPFTLRAAWLAMSLAMLTMVIVREVVWPVMAIPDEDQLALWVERESPGLGSRLIAAIQLTRAHGIPAGQSLAMVGALVRETEEIAGPMDFTGVVKLDRLAQRGAVAALFLLLGIVATAYGGKTNVGLLERAFLVPGVDVPRRTHVQMLIPNPLVIAVGETAELRAQASGIIPTSGTVSIKYDGQAQPVTFPLPADPAHAAQFILKLETVPASFTYRVSLNDGHGIDGRVLASSRPVVASMDIAEIYPAYTRLGVVRHSPDDLRILSGSQLAIRIKSNKPVKNTAARDRPFNRVTLQTKGGSVDIPLMIQGGDRQTLVAEDSGNPDIPVPNDARGLSIHLVDDDGLQTKDPAVYGIQMIPDLPPTLRITYPDRKEQLSTARARLVVGVDASDDFGLGRLMLHYRVLPPELAQATAADSGAAPLLPPVPDWALPKGKKHSRDSAPVPEPSAIATDSIELDLNGDPRTFRGQFRFDLSQLKTPPLEHGAVEWWVEADDANDVTGPGRTLSDHYLTRIGTEAEVRSELFARLGNHIGEIKEADEAQKQDNADLGAMIQEKAAR
jgi:hypothetical protein